MTAKQFDEEQQAYHKQSINHAHEETGDVSLDDCSTADRGKEAPKPFNDLASAVTSPN